MDMENDDGILLRPPAAAPAELSFHTNSLSLSLDLALSDLTFVAERKGREKKSLRTQRGGSTADKKPSLCPWRF